MLKFYFNGSPNPTKVALFLEEAGIAYQPVPVDTRAGDQFKPEYLAINPNAKVPAIDDDGIKVFDSNAILLYLAEKTGKFLPPTSPANRAELLSWLMFVATGVGPYSGQAVHFKHFSPEKIDYAHNRYQFEAQRHFAVLNDHLAKRRYMVGDTYTIVDMDALGLGPHDPLRDGRGRLREISQRQAAGRRNLGTAGGGQGDRAEGQFQVQGGNGRRGAPQHVQAPRGEGGLISATLVQNGALRGRRFRFSRRAPPSPRSRPASPAAPDG